MLPMKYGSFGTVSHATVRTEDLLKAFAPVLEDLVQVNADKWVYEEQKGDRDRWLELVKTAREVDPKTEEAFEIVCELMDALTTFAPPLAYFGSHPGDGSDYGFWLSEDALDEFDGLKVDDLSQVPVDYVGMVLHTNDHGNMTLYCSDNGELTEVWSIV